MYELKLGKSVKGLISDFYEQITKAKELGFESIDVVLCECGYEGTDEQIEELKKRIVFLKTMGLRFNNVHLPYGADWDISVLEEEKRKSVLKNVKTAVDWIEPLAPYCYVIHGSSGPIMDDERALRLIQLEKSVRELQKYTNTPMAVENMPRTGILNTSAEMTEFANRMEKVDFCLDVNHFLRELPEDAILQIGDKVITTHISDHNFVDERHWLPGKGKIDWQKVIKALESVDYKGVFNYEVGQDVTLEEIKKNFDLLFKEYNL